MRKCHESFGTWPSSPARKQHQRSTAYADVTSKFANVIEVVDIDPNGDGSPADAAIVGQLLTNATSTTAVDDAVTDYAGMGGQGVLPIPLAYEGWVERAPKNAVNNQLTCKQRNPLTFKKKC